MRILLDECLPRKLKLELSPHEVNTVIEMGWSGVKNGALLRQAESQFDVFLTVDRNLPYQQNMSSYNIAVIVLISRNNAIETLRPLMAPVLRELQSIRAGEMVQIESKKKRR
jgi:hypothetical protein